MVSFKLFALAKHSLRVKTRLATVITAFALAEHASALKIVALWIPLRSVKPDIAPTPVHAK